MVTLSGLSGFTRPKTTLSCSALHGGPRIPTSDGKAYRSFRRSRRRMAFHQMEQRRDEQPLDGQISPCVYLEANFAGLSDRVPEIA